MRFGVEDVLVERDEVLIVGEQQEHVLERLAEEERLHLVARSRVPGVGDVRYRRIAAILDTTVLLERLQHIPTPVLVALVTGQAVQDEVRLHRLRAQQVVFVVRLQHGQATRQGKKKKKRT